MQPRPYQSEAMAALDAYLAQHDDNPVIELPTGAGKTPVMAWTIQRYLKAWPGTRILVLAHVRELLTQGVEKMTTIWPDAPIGVYCSALKRKDKKAAITFASIQSIHRHAFDFDPFDLIFVDEAHRIPLKGETTYRSFIADAKMNCPHLRVVGWTATPYRLGGGRIYGPEYVLNSVAYRVSVKELIDDGYLCRLRSKRTENEMDMAGVRTAKGEFVESDLDARFNQADVVSAAVSEALARLPDRKSILFFCCSISHAESVSEELKRRGVIAPVVSAKTEKGERDSYTSGFVAGRYRAICNVNVLSEGFDAQRVDAVVMLRPTQSAALYYQQVGRGLRLHDSKSDCLVLDFAGNVSRHGPIDALNEPEKKGTGPAPVKECPNCKELVRISASECPDCGYIFPPPERDPTPPHDAKPHDVDILSGVPPWTMTVRDVRVDKYRSKKSDKDMLRVTYHGTLEAHTEFVCLDHDGYARQKAAIWWAKRFKTAAPKNTAEALPTLFSIHQISDALKAITKEITVAREGKYTKVIGYKLEASTDASTFTH